MLDQQSFCSLLDKQAPAHRTTQLVPSSSQPHDLSPQPASAAQAVSACAVLAACAGLRSPVARCTFRTLSAVQPMCACSFWTYCSSAVM
eukprot:m.241081 g.241081  ORF g.241081 m.241081 type:complete len:89 (+) comp54414_c1_seq15:265-531(+)